MLVSSFRYVSIDTPYQFLISLLSRVAYMAIFNTSFSKQTDNFLFSAYDSISKDKEQNKIVVIKERNKLIFCQF